MDEAGKILDGKNEYFDFSISSVTTLAEINYQIYAVKQEGSVLADEWIKVYLTEKEGNKEIASPLVLNDDKVLTFKDLMGDNNVKLIYEGTVPMSNKEYHKDFRLRIWLNNELSIIGREEEFFGKSFSLKVKVTANEQ